MESKELVINVGSQNFKARRSRPSANQYITKAAATESVDLCLALHLQCRYHWGPLVEKGEADKGTYRGPRGAQYCPVMLISNFSMNSTSDLAATSGVTAAAIIRHLYSHKQRAATYHLQHPKICQIPRL